MRLIDADDLDNVVLRLNEEGRTITRSEYKTVDSIIFEFPTIEAEPVRRGRWVEEPGMFMCSVCHDVWSTEDEEMIKGFNYCPWCGAKMEEQKV